MPSLIPAAALLAVLHTPSAALTLADGVQVPIGALGKLPALLEDVVRQAPPDKTINDLMPVIETVADLYFPGAGIAASLIWYVVTHQKPWTREDEERWWARAQGDH